MVNKKRPKDPYRSQRDPGGHRQLYLMTSCGPGFNGKGRGKVTNRHHNARLDAKWKAKMQRQANLFTLVRGTPPIHGQGRAYEDDYHMNENLEWDGDDDIGTCAHILLALQNRKRKRVKDAARHRLAENWKKVGGWLAAYSLEQEVPPCSCEAVEDVEVRVISLIGYKRVIVQYCICGQRCAQVIKRGLFPTTPIKPRTLFSTDLIQLLHLQSMRGSCSKYAWAEGLRDMLEMSVGQLIPQFLSPLRNAYHNWLAVTYLVDTNLASTLEGIDGIWKEEALENQCPSCFDFSRHAGDGSVGISVDGNLQHSRYRDLHHMTFEDLPTKVFVGVNRRDYSLSTQTKDGNLKGAGTCGHLFKATKGWSRSEEGGAGSLPSAKNFDEKGLVGFVCLHGIPLRYVNIYTGERQTHVTSLIENVLVDRPEIKLLRLCYDVACVFGPALKTLLPDLAPRIETKIGRFHIYGHGQSCHTLFNLIRSPGWGLMVGEENEYDWARMAHLVASGRVSSGPRRSQKIDAYALFTARLMKERMGRMLHQRYKRAGETINLKQTELDLILGTVLPSRALKDGSVKPEVTITKQYLITSAAEQEQYYRTYRQVSISLSALVLETGLKVIEDPRDEIFDALCEERRLSHNLAINIAQRAQRGNAHRGVIRNEFRQHVTPLTMQQLQASGYLGLKAVTKTTSLLVAIGDSRSMWEETGELYRKYQKRRSMAKLHRLQTRLIEVITTRNLEIETLDRRIRGVKQASRFRSALNKRWSALNDIVKEYNHEIDGLSRLVRGGDDVLPRKLNVDELRSVGITNDEIWDLDRMLTRQDWAVFPQVREGIEAMFKIDRAQEELLKLVLHVKRMVSWLDRQCDVLLQAAFELSLPRHKTNCLLLQRLRMVDSLLFIKNEPADIAEFPPLLPPDCRQNLVNIARRIKAVLEDGVEDIIGLEVIDDMEGIDESEIEELDSEELVIDESGLDHANMDEEVGEALAAEGLRDDIEERRNRELPADDDEVELEN